MEGFDVGCTISSWETGCVWPVTEGVGSENVVVLQVNDGRVEEAVIKRGEGWLISVGENGVGLAVSQK